MKIHKFVAAALYSILYTFLTAYCAVQPDGTWWCAPLVIAAFIVLAALFLAWMVSDSTNSHYALWEDKKNEYKEVGDDMETFHRLAQKYRAAIIIPQKGKKVKIVYEDEVEPPFRSGNERDRSAMTEADKAALAKLKF